MAAKFSYKTYLRKPSRGEKTFFAVLSALFLLTGPALFFEPYDWGQQTVSAMFNSKPYEGDGVVVAIDEDTLEKLPDREWTRAELAALLEKIRQGNPGKVAIEEQFFAPENSSGDDALQNVLARFASPPIWQVNISSDGLEQLQTRRSVREQRGEDASAAGTDSALGETVIPAAMPFKRSMFPAPLKTAYVVTSGDSVYPTTANLLSGAPAPRDNAFTIDLSYDPRSVPVVSAAAVLGGSFDVAELRGKKVVVAFQTDARRDTFSTPQSGYTPKAVVTLLAAQTLQDGPPVSIGWLPSLLFAIAGGAAWFFLKKPLGRRLVVVCFLVLVLAPILFEQALIYQNTSNGIAFLGVLFLGKVWQKSGRAVRTYRAAAETKSRFLAQASHDLRQPIHAIGLLADRLERTDLTSEQRELVAKISWSVDNASRMFRALLDIAAIESGALQTNIGPVSINDLFAEVDNQNSLAAEQADVEIRMVPCDLVVETDRALVGTMLQNLVSNAIKYARGKSIVVGCRRKGDTLSIFVVDSGQGISRNELKLVRKDFYRGARKSLLRSDNKGLGLAIVSRLADMLGLKFVLSSEEGKGTSAAIKGLRVLKTGLVETQRVNQQSLPLAGLSVHLADDDVEALESMRELLEHWGCSVKTSARFPKEGVEEDILLTDFDFGQGDTLKAHAQDLAEMQSRGIRVGIISGHHLEQIQSEIPSFSGLILAKPLRTAELRSALMALRTDA